MKDMKAPLPDLKQYAAELKRAEDEGFTFRLDMNATETVAFIGNLQLALRCPGNDGPTSKLCRKTVDAMIQTISIRYPILAAVIRAGDNPAHDC